MQYRAPDIRCGHGIVQELAAIEGTVAVLTMEAPWRLVQKALSWRPSAVHFVSDMRLETL